MYILLLVVRIVLLVVYVELWKGFFLRMMLIFSFVVFLILCLVVLYDFILVLWIEMLIMFSLGWLFIFIVLGMSLIISGMILCMVLENFFFVYGYFFLNLILMDELFILKCWIVFIMFFFSLIMRCWLGMFLIEINVSWLLYCCFSLVMIEGSLDLIFSLCLVVLSDMLFVFM